MTGKKKNRDDFSQKTINALRRRAGNRCSNPDCRVPTDAPSDEGPEKVNSIGEAAHITAAAEGGPRYNKALKPEERRSITNGIWLCANCADKIDKDEKTYTVELLHEWKRTAEESAQCEQGKKLPDEQAAVNTLVAAATGQTSVFLPNLMPNASKAASSYLENLDERFNITTDIIDGVTRYTALYKEDDPYLFKPTNEFADEFYEKYVELRDSGKDFSLDISAMDIDESELLRKLVFESKGKVNFLNLNKKETRVQLSLESQDGKEKLISYELNGYASTGNKEITINTSSIDGNISLHLSLKRKDDVNRIVTIENTLSFDSNSWSSLSVEKIPQFDLLFDFYQKVTNGWKIVVSIDIEKLLTCTFSITGYIDSEYFTGQFNHLQFVRAARIISKYLKLAIPYDSSFKYDYNLHKKIIAVSTAIEKGLYKEDFSGTVRFQLSLIDTENRNIQFDGCLKKDLINHKVCIFGKELVLPNFSMIFTNMILNNTRIVDTILNVELISTDSSKYVVKIIDNTNNTTRK